MTNQDLNSMSKAELLAIRNDAERAMKSLEDRRRSEAKSILEAQAKELGFSIAELFDGKSKAKSAGAPKYRHPENPAMTWSGKGRQPAWFKEHIAAGGDAGALAL